MLQAFTNIKRFRDDPLGFTEEVERNYGALASMRFGPKRFHFINDADFAEHVLLKNGGIYKKSRLIFNQIIPITGRRGLVQLEDEEWATWRAHTGEMFTKQAFLFYPAIIERYLAECANALGHAADTGTAVDIADLFITYTIRTAVKIFLACDDDDAARAIASTFIELNHRCGRRMRNLINWPLFIKTENNRAVVELSAILRARLGALIADAWLRKDDRSLIGHLVRAFPEKSDEATAIITDHLMTFLFAGFETTSASLAFCFYLLAKHPRAQERVWMEIATHQSENILALEDIKRYAYASAVYKEALRMFPPAWIVAREAMIDDEIATHRIRKSDTIIVCIRQIQRNADLWEDAPSYLPERFLSPTSRPKKCAFMPFGVGPRICSGTQLAMLEGVNAVVNLCRQFSFATSSDDLALKALVTLNPKEPVMLTVRRL